MKNVLTLIVIICISIIPVLSQNKSGVKVAANSEIYKKLCKTENNSVIITVSKGVTWYSYDGYDFFKADDNKFQPIKFSEKNGNEYISYDFGYQWVISKSTTLNNVSIQEGGFNLYPNPVGSVLSVSFKSVSSVENAEIYIENLIGERILVWQGGLKPGNNEMTIDTRNFVTGSYLIIVNDYHCLQSKQLRIVK